MERRSLVVAGELVRVTCNGRRYFSRAHKEAVIAKCLAPGASLAAVALANGFNANLVRKWVRQRLARQAQAKPSAKLLPVTITDSSARLPASAGESIASRRPVRRYRAQGTIEIELSGARLVLSGVVDAEALRVVLAVLISR